MLESMRNSMKSPIALVFMALIVLSFVVWGTGDVFRAGTGDAVVIVGPQKITVNQLSTRWQQEVSSRTRSSNGKFSEIDAKAQGIDEQLLERMISEAALDAKLDELGVSVSSKMVLKYAKGYDAFRDPLTGQFSDEQYLETLNQAQMTPAMFEADARADIRRQQILSLLTDAMASPIAFTRNMMAFQQELRQVESIFLPAEIQPKAPEPTTEQLETLLTQNPAQFAIPERRAATLVLISASDLELEIQPTEEELRELFRFNIANYSQAETRSWLQITVADQVIAERVSNRLAAGEQAVTIMADMQIEGAPIELTDVIVTNAPDDQIAKAVFEGDVGATGVAEGRFQWAAWKLTAITEGYQQDFEEVRTELAKEFTREEARNRLFEIMGDFEGSRADGLTLDEAAQAQNLVAISLPPVDRRARDENLQVIDIFAKNPEILETLFLFDELVESDIEETSNGDFFALHVDEIVPLQNPQMSEILETLTSAWKLQWSSNAMHELAKAVKTDLENQIPPQDIVAKHLGSRVEISILSRYQPEPSIPPELARQIFSTDLGKAAYGVMPASNEVVVSRLQTIIPSPVISDQNLIMLRSRMDQEVERDLESQFVTGLRASYTIRRDERLKALAFGDE